MQSCADLGMGISIFNRMKNSLFLRRLSCGSTCLGQVQQLRHSGRPLAVSGVLGAFLLRMR